MILLTQSTSCSRATTLGGIERQLFSTALSARARPFIPSSILMATKSAKKEDDEGEDAGDVSLVVEEVEVTEEEQQAINVARAAKEAEQVALETEHAVVCQRAVRRRLKREEEQRTHAAHVSLISLLVKGRPVEQRRADVPMT